MMQVIPALQSNIEIFEIVGSSPAQQAEDEGWYFQTILGTKPIGEPYGPFLTQGIAEQSWRDMRID